MVQPTKRPSWAKILCFWFKNNLSLKTENPCKCQKQSTDTPCLCTAQHGTAQGPAPRCNNNEDTLAILYITSVSRCNAGSPSPREKQSSCPLAFLPAYAAARMARVHSLSTAAQRLGQPSLPKPEHPPSTTIMLIPHHLWWGFNIGRAFVSLNPTGPVSFVTHSVYLTRFPQQEPCWSTMLSLSWARWPPTEKWWEKTQVVPQAIAHNPLQLLLLMHLCLFLP